MMGNKKQRKGFLGRVLGRLGVGGMAAVFSLVAVVGWAALTVESLTYDPHKNMISLDQKDWGAEVFDAIHDNVIAQGLVRPANACGLGASSCFRCHNGRRAPEPTTDPIAAPWHTDHARVNNSCAGCHSGNPRLMREEMAHQNLISKPLNSPSESCASCHRSASELEGFLDRYLAVQQ
ncbi:hypothetical protein Tgr7_0071 [Thioalkalivibrio sulfidiphilus HL-EbGr7]|uniref:Uncharacterized protein n=2 Tax=Thioalkalivibrio TaxID=106633 RepID=B8GTB5_THISH|nr:hypothetical protein [Thioalkalivibrio sulfidiphilus]ACL71175.1 hypothetical protein Tgr7_0071 [Thioalkalivibrio sulfidiphilus HL-EbGr7]